jgi:hypothetical protein
VIAFFDLCHKRPDFELQLFRRTCADPGTAVEFLRADNNAVVDHFYTSSAAEMANAVASLGYVFEGTVGRIFPATSSFTVPLFRVANSALSDHFYTTDAAERNNAINTLGYSDEGIAGFVYPASDTSSQSVCSAIPLFRLYNPTAFDHFYTQSASERDNAISSNGYVSEGIAAFILAV